jgi:hypothetical protein
VYVRLISLANLYGNTFDAVLGQLAGRSVVGSHFLEEIAVLILGATGVSLGILITRASPRAARFIFTPRSPRLNHAWSLRLSRPFIRSCHSSARSQPSVRSAASAHCWTLAGCRWRYESCFLTTAPSRGRSHYQRPVGVDVEAGASLRANFNQRKLRPSGCPFPT